MMTVNAQQLLELLEEPMRAWCAADGGDPDRLLAAGRWPGISTLARRSGVGERTLRRLLNGEQDADLLMADSLLAATGLSLADLPGALEDLHAPSLSELMLTVDDAWSFR